MKSIKNVFVIAAVVASSLSGNVQAQYASVESDKAAKESAKTQLVDEARQKLIGKRFWIEPNPEAIQRKKFTEQFDELRSYKDVKFVVTEPVSFVISGYKRWHMSQYVEVTFDDGKVAYLPEGNMFSYDPKKYEIFDDIYTPTEAKVDYKEYILPMSPADLRLALAKQKKKAAAAAAAWKARGGVSIGMTAEQVRQSNWGRPTSINRTSGAYGVHEQWVYGGRNYIYFENGRVSSIQN